MNYLPDISVIVCCHNHEMWIERCIRSLTHQININPENYEIIIVNDASTDNVKIILENLVGLSNLKIIENETNIGLPSSLNKAIKAARGRYIVRVDSDDYVSRQFLYLTMLFLDMNRNYQAVAVDYNIVDKFENIIRRVNCLEEEIACGIMFRKECLFEIGLYDEEFKMREGHDLKKRFIEKFNIARLEFPLYKYREHDKNRTKNKDELKIYNDKLILKNIKDAKENVKKYNLKASNNVNLICEKLYYNSNIDGNYVECGVYQGNTIITVAEFLRNIGQQKKLIGFDTFGGFPPIINEKDHPIYFNELLKKNLITQEHYEMAKIRTNNFTLENHLTSDYFSNVGDLFNIVKNYTNIQLVKGSFVNTLVNYNEKIGILFLDCDLYQSYLDCLNALYDKVILNGIIIFDEYYSLKYPGARLAIEEFFSDKVGKFEKYFTEGNFERVCFIKEQ